MADNIFSKIVRREIPATIVYEDNESLAFLDIHPVHKGHTLLIPKETYAWVDDVPDELLGKMFVKAKKLIQAIKKSLPCDFVQISVVGKDVPHFHIHLIPRWFNDELKAWETMSYESGEADAFAEKIKNSLS